MIWRPVVGYEGDYEVSDLGGVRSITFRNNVVRKRRAVPKALSPSVSGKGYATVMLSGRIRRRVHRLVLEAFIGPCPNGHECSHLNGNPRDNRLVNLAYETRADNHARKLQHGTNCNGEKNHESKLTDSEVIEIRNARQNGETLKAIAKRFNVSFSTVGRISRGEDWRHLL